MQKNDFIRIKYALKLKEAQVDVGKEREIPVVVGRGWLPEFVEKALLDMKVGGKKTVKGPAGKIFGERDDKRIRTVPVAEFKKHGQMPKPGMVFNANNMECKVLSVSSGRVKIDFNHPLSGKMLTPVYSIEIVSKIENDEERIKSMLESFLINMNMAPEDFLKNTHVKVVNNELEITIPTSVDFSFVFRKKVSNDAMDIFGFKRVKFSELYEKPKEEDKKKIDKLNEELELTEVDSDLD